MNLDVSLFPALCVSGFLFEMFGRTFRRSLPSIFPTIVRRERLNAQPPILALAPKYLG